MFFRVFQHLLPRSQAWRTTTQKKLRGFFEGLAEEPARIRQYYDEIYLDLFPDTTRELAQWEAEFGLEPNSDEGTRRLRLAAEWQASGGQSPRYVQDVLQTAGFPVYVHEWWESGPPYVSVRDPNAYTELPTIGTSQCDGTMGTDQAQCSALAGQPQCDAFLANDPGYIVNLDLTPRPPPPIPDDEDAWRGFMYVGGETFPDVVVIPASRREEFQRLLMKLRPLHLWVVTLVQYGGIFDDTFDTTFG
ncbi:MAG TPA: putative phage tail protein [Polyangiaceae bacterium]